MRFGWQTGRQAGKFAQLLELCLDVITCGFLNGIFDNREVLDEILRVQKVLHAAGTMSGDALKAIAPQRKVRQAHAGSVETVKPI